MSEQEARALEEFSRHFGITFNDPSLLKLALTHRSYLSVTGQGPRESNERLEFLGDSVLGLVTSEFLYRLYPGEHEGHLTKIKSLLVSKAILSRRALAMGLGRFVLMSHSEIESGGRQRLSILADAFEAVLGAVYLDQGFEEARAFIDRWLLRDARAITSDERHVNYKSHLQEYVQSTYHTHPVYRIRSEYGPDHSKHFNVDVMVGRRVLGSGKGRNKKEAEQAAARGALDQAGALPRATESHRSTDFEEAGGAEGFAPELESESEPLGSPEPSAEGGELETADEPLERRSRRRGRRGGRGRRARETAREAAPGEAEGAGRIAGSIAAETRSVQPETPAARTGAAPPSRIRPWRRPDDEFEEVGRPDAPHEEAHIDPYDWEGRGSAATEAPGDRDEQTASELDERKASDRDEQRAGELDERKDDERSEESREGGRRRGGRPLFPQIERVEGRGEGRERAPSEPSDEEPPLPRPPLEAPARSARADETEHAADAIRESRERLGEIESLRESAREERIAPAPDPTRAEPRFGRRSARSRPRPGGR